MKGSLHDEAQAIEERLRPLVTSLPKRAAAHVRTLARLVASAGRRSQRRRFGAMACKEYLGMLNRSGWALDDLFRASQISHGTP